MKVQEIIEDLEFCKGIFDYTISPNEITKLVDYIKQLQQENNQLKDYIKELEENSGVLVSQVESWSKSSDDYLEKYHKLLEQRQELRSWLEEQEKRAWDEVSSTFGYVLDKLNELEGGKND